MSLSHPIITLISQTAQMLSAQANTMPFFGLVIVENPELLPIFKAQIPFDSMVLKCLVLKDFLTLEFSQYYDLAVVIIDNLTADTITTLARCRDVVARHSLLFAPSTQDFIAFGFSKVSQAPVPFEGKDYVAWQFNLYDYKQLPDWLNSRFWANPENWDKFRW